MRCLRFPMVLCRIRWPLLLAAFLLLGGRAAQASEQPPSVLEIPFSFSLQGLFRETERIVPAQVGSWHRWQRRHGVDTRYSAWRGPLAFRLSGDTLTLQAHVRYRVQVRKSLLGVEVKAGCGVEEAPRQALIGLQVRLAWNPDWTPRPQFRLLPVRFLDRCEMTAADIDVTPLVGREFQQRMRESLHRALADLAPAMGSLRRQAAEIWRKMNGPLALAEKSWLQLNPVAVALSPLYGSETEARVHLAVALRPRLRHGERPADRPTELPPLRPFFPRSGGVRFQLSLESDYERIGSLLSTALAGRSFQVEGYRFGIDSVVLSGEGRELHVKLGFTGQARGSAEIWLEVGFIPETKTLGLKDLDYLFEPVDNDLYAMAGMFYEKIRQLLLDSANRLLERALADWEARLELALASIAPEGARLDLDDIEPRKMDIEFLPTGVRFKGSAEGSIRVRL